MVKIKRFFRRWWWAIMIAAAATLWLLREMFTPIKAPGWQLPPPKFLEKAKVEVERVRLEGEVEKAKVRATADVQREQIEAIEEEGKEDPAKAREEMAAWLAKNL